MATITGQAFRGMRQGRRARSMTPAPTSTGTKRAARDSATESSCRKRAAARNEKDQTRTVKARTKWAKPAVSHAGAPWLPSAPPRIDALDRPDRLLTKRLLDTPAQLVESIASDLRADGTQGVAHGQDSLLAQRTRRTAERA